MTRLIYKTCCNKTCLHGFQAVKMAGTVIEAIWMLEILEKGNGGLVLSAYLHMPTWITRTTTVM